VIKFTRTPPPITKAREGSQSSLSVRNPTTLVHQHIPDIANPSPKINPKIKHKGISNLDLLSYYKNLNIASEINPINIRAQRAIEK